jgi:hypothetical protein
VKVGAVLAVEAVSQSRPELELRPKAKAECKVEIVELKGELVIREPKVELKRELVYQRSS